MDPFAIHLVCGMVVVHFFTETFNGGTRSLVSNRGLIVKLPDAARAVPRGDDAGGLLAHHPDARDHGHRQRRCWAGRPMPSGSRRRSWR